MSKYRQEMPDIVDRMIALERRLSILERTPQIGATTIDKGDLVVKSGGIKVLDSNGDTVVEIGPLSDGGYGVSSINDVGQLVQLSTISFGQQASFDTSNGSTTTNGYVDLSGTDPGPILNNVSIGDTGRCIVMVSAQMQATPTPASTGAKCAMSFSITGATTQAAADDRALVVYNAVNVAGFHQFIMRASYVHYLDTLNPGLHNFTAKYSSGSSGTTASFADRLIYVQPF